jgi:adenosylcobinamide-GDP ribazoletransferase
VTGFAAAVQFLTRVPVRLAAPPSLASSVPWFPVVGGLVRPLVASPQACTT